MTDGVSVLIHVMTAVKQQVITRAHVDRDQSRHIASLDRNEFIRKRIRQRTSMYVLEKFRQNMPSSLLRNGHWGEIPSLCNETEAQ